ncbi:hypothetical protein [Sulfuracidifex tepidarius]|uniref:hypothetical protein n=1 Tax=Sulfuracidifex tepidarius TaxID=1294262 RepID=UPI0006D074E8|nr:hypothetical protein [Sulfuracidifex tepidarius]
MSEADEFLIDPFMVLSAYLARDDKEDCLPNSVYRVSASPTKPSLHPNAHIYVYGLPAGAKAVLYVNGNRYETDYHLTLYGSSFVWTAFEVHFGGKVCVPIRDEGR